MPTCRKDCFEKKESVKKANMEKNNQQNPTLLNTLICRARQNDDEAFEELLKRYTPLIENMTSQFTARCEQSEDREDLRQEAILGFYKALTRYNTDQTEVQFGLYAKECIRNRLTSYLRRIKKYEQIRPLEDENSEMIEDAEQDPVNRIVEQENYLELYNRVCSMLSDYENRVWWMYLSGRTAAEIASKLDKDEKSVQNAIYRIRRKLRSVIPYP